MSCLTWFSVVDLRHMFTRPVKDMHHRVLNRTPRPADVAELKAVREYLHNRMVGIAASDGIDLKDEVVDDRLSLVSECDQGIWHVNSSYMTGVYNFMGAGTEVAFGPSVYVLPEGHALFLSGEKRGIACTHRSPASKDPRMLIVSELRFDKKS